MSNFAICGKPGGAHQQKKKKTYAHQRHWPMAFPGYPEIGRFRKFEIILELCHLRGKRLKTAPKPFWHIKKKKKKKFARTPPWPDFPHFGKVRGHEFFVRDSWSTKQKRKFWCFFSNSFFSKKTCEDTNLKHEHRMGCLMILGDTDWFCKVGPWFWKVDARQLVN